MLVVMNPPAAVESAEPAAPRRGTRLRVLGQVAAGVLVATLAAELILRLLGAGDLDLYRPDPIRGIAHRPGASGWFRKEGGSFVVINSAGFRDRERSPAKPPGTFRVAVLGDSFTEALQVPPEQTFCAVMERELERCEALEGRRIEVLNFGVSDYGPASELLTLRSRVWDYRPDIVLLAFFPGNDVLDNVPALKGNPRMPYFRLRDGRLVLDDSFRALLPKEGRATGLAAALIRRSRLLQRLRQVYVRFRDRPADALDEFSPAWPQNPVYRPTVDADWREAWRLTEATLEAMREECEAHGVPFGLVVLSTAPQVHPDPRATGPLRRALGVGDLFEPDRRLSSIAARNGIPILDLAPILAREARTRRLFFHGFGSALGHGHLNADGHRRVGQLAADWLCRLVRPSASPGGRGGPGA